MNNVVFAVFSPEFHDELFVNIKYHGLKRADATYINSGLSQSFVRAAIRRIVRHRGW